MPVKKQQILKFTVIIITVFFFVPSLTQGKNLTVPFSSQAPDGNWSQPWQDFCEETSIMMVNSFYAGKTLTKKSAKEDILLVNKIKETVYDKSLDENAEKITSLINNFLPWSSQVINNPTLKQLKEQIDLGQPVLLPVYGKALRNPYFKNGGPDYHLIVISGYDNSSREFITNDPGTRRGLDFRYNYDTILGAMHDYLPNKQTKNGQVVAIFTKKDIASTSGYDGDHDGLNKEEEIFYGSKTWLKDSDGDGYIDGEEVKNGYSPTKKLQKL